MFIEGNMVLPCAVWARFSVVSKKRLKSYHGIAWCKYDRVPNETKNYLLHRQCCNGWLPTPVELMYVLPITFADWQCGLSWSVCFLMLMLPSVSSSAHFERSCAYCLSWRTHFLDFLSMHVSRHAADSASLSKLSWHADQVCGSKAALLPSCRSLVTTISLFHGWNFRTASARVSRSILERGCSGQCFHGARFGRAL